MLNCTKHLKVLVAHRPGFVQPVLLARMAATLDHLTGGGRIAIHFITGGDEADQRREGDFVPHDARYRPHRRGDVDRAPHLGRGHALRLRRRVLPLRGGVQLGQAGHPGGHPPLLRRRLASGHRGRRGPGRRLRLLGRAPGRGGRPHGDHRARRRPRSGRTLRYSISLRPIIADTEQEAWEKAEWIAEETAERIELAKERMAAPRRPTRVSAGRSNATFSVDRDTGGTTSVGRKRLIEMSADQDVYDERLWMKVANLTGAAGNSTALVGTPEQVAEAMLRYYDLGITTLLLKGFDPLADAVEFGAKLLPLVREGAERRDAAGVH